MNGWYRDGGILISIANWEQIDAVQMLLPTCMYLLGRSHDILWDTLALVVYYLPVLSTGDFFGGTYNPRAVLLVSGVTLSSLRRLSGTRLSLPRVDSCLLGRWCYASPLSAEVILFLFDSLADLFSFSAFYRLRFSTAEFGRHRRDSVCLSIWRQQLVVLLGIAVFVFDLAGTSSIVGASLHGAFYCIGSGSNWIYSWLQHFWVWFGYHRCGLSSPYFNWEQWCLGGAFVLQDGFCHRMSLPWRTHGGTLFYLFYRPTVSHLDRVSDSAGALQYLWGFWQKVFWTVVISWTLSHEHFLRSTLC